MTVYVGIDPGVSGAIAAIADGRVQVWDTPSVQATNASGKKVSHYDESAMLRILAECVQAIGGRGEGHGQIAAALEVCQFRPGVDVRTAGMVGVGWGMWKMALAASGIPVHLVAAASWKAQVFRNTGLQVPKGYVGDRTKEMKANSRILIQRIFPEDAHLFSRVKDHDRAEAALLAYWLKCREETKR